MPMNRDPEMAEIQHVNDFADLHALRILEIGCGDGRLTWRYAEQPQRIAAIDIGAEWLSEALAARPPTLRNTVSFTQAQAQELPFAAESFDGAILAWSL